MFPDEQAKLRYLISRLSSTPRQIFDDHIQSGYVTLQDTDTVFALLDQDYMDEFKRANARTSIINEKQKNKSFEEWFPKFRVLAIDTGYPHEVLQSHLFQNISYEYKKELLSRGGNPETYTSLVEKLRQIGNDLRHLNEYAYHAKTTTPSSSTPKSHAPRPTPVTTAVVVQAPSTATGTYTGPMDMSVTRGPLSEQERVNRRAKGLCLYCGEPGHLARSCPNSKRTKHLHVAEAEIAPTFSSSCLSPSSPAESGNGVSLS